MKKVYRDGLEIEIIDKPRVMTRDGHVCEVFKTKEGTLWFVTLKGTPFCAHGNSFREAVTAAKEKQNPGSGKKDAIKRVNKSGRITLNDFCLITNACRAGAVRWAKENGFSLTARPTVEKVLRMLDNSASSSWGNILKKELEAHG
jgi:hypothetical protein